MKRAIVLFSGGLDSTLAVRILQEQGWEVEALNVRTTFQCCRVPAAQAAAELGVRLQIAATGDDYLDVLRRPRHGYGTSVNPCVDCRIHMARLAKEWMRHCGASLVATGEVLGQREMSQKRVDLDVIAKESGLEGRLLRPLCALLLAPTQAEQEGLVDRSRLFSFHGRGRRELIDLARRLGVRHIPGPSTGCRLAERAFAPRMRDLLVHRPDAGRWEFEALKTGRHLRLSPEVKLILGRNAVENDELEQLVDRADAPRCALVEPDGFPGPTALVCGEASEGALQAAAALVVEKSRTARSAWVRVWQAGAALPVRIEAAASAASEHTVWL